MRRVQMFVVLMLLLGLLAGCGSPEQPAQPKEEYPAKIVIQAPPAPPTAPLLKLIADKPFGDKVAVELILYKSVEEATARVIKGEADFTILPLNTAAKLYQKQPEFTLANVTTWGILYMLSAEDVAGWEQLKGKEVYVGAKGASPDIITRYLLDQNKLAADAVTLKYASSPEIAQLMIQGLAKTAVLPEPQVTQVISKNPAVKVVLDYQQEWQGLEGNANGLPQAGMVVQNKFAQNYPALLGEFQQAYQQALQQTVENPAAVSGLVQEQFNIPGPVFEKSMARTNIKFVQASEAKADVENYLSKLLQFSPELVGGKLPDEKFYLAK